MAVTLYPLFDNLGVNELAPAAMSNVS